jgi:predicted RNase H-like nuclease (RuvC/YqgF family)
MAGVLRIAMAGMTPTEAAGLITAAGTAGAAVMGAYTAIRKRRSEQRQADDAEELVIITQAQGANLIMDATVKALNTQLDREVERADRWRRRVEELDAELDACRRELRDSKRRRA